MDVNQVLILQESDKNKCIPTPEQYYNICRVCLIDLDSPDITKTTINGEIGQIKIESLLEKYTPFRISTNDLNLPQHLCSNCTDYLLNMHIFHSRCLLNEDLLQKLLKRSQEFQSQTTSESPEEIKNNDIQNTDTESVQSNQTVNFTPSTRLKSIIDKINNELIGIFSCQYCPEEFTNEKDLRKHRLEVRHSRTQSCPCPYCGKLFKSNKIKEHLRSHTNEKPFKCDQCDASFAARARWVRHKRIHLTDKPVCEVCDRQFSSPETLYFHKKSKMHLQKCGIAVETPIRKKPCRKLNNDGDNLNIQNFVDSYIHQQTQSDLKPFNCNICGKTFKFKHNLKTHELMHVSGRKFQCDICFKFYKTKAYLQMHKYTHDSGDISCSECGKGFSKKFLLERHMQIHSDVKDYQCTICLKRFRQDGHLKVHMRTHTGEQPFTCEYCGRTFALNGNLTVHRRIHTGELPYPCRMCGKCFRDSSTRKKHENKWHCEFNSQKDDGNISLDQGSDNFLDGVIKEENVVDYDLTNDLAPFIIIQKQMN